MGCWRSRAARDSRPLTRRRIRRARHRGAPAGLPRPIGRRSSTRRWPRSTTPVRWSTISRSCNDLRRDIFLAKGAELPAIADTLANLSGAAGNTAELSPQAIVSAGLGIAGALAGAVAPEIGIPLAIAAYIAGVIPSDTPSLNTAFNGTYAQLQSKFAAAETEADAGLIDQSYVVRQNWGLLALISQLTAPTGPWAKLDEAGLKSAMDEGFALSHVQATGADAVHALRGHRLSGGWPVLLRADRREPGHVRLTTRLHDDRRVPVLG